MKTERIAIKSKLITLVMAMFMCISVMIGVFVSFRGESASATDYYAHCEVMYNIQSDTPGY